MSEGFQLREVFNAKIVNLIADNIQNAYPDFEKTEFIKSILSSLDKLSFGDRNTLITDALYKYLPKNFEEVASILLNSLGPEVEMADLSGYEGFYVMPLSHYVARYGGDHFDISMNLLYEMTKRFTSEWPIRTFIQIDQEKSFEFFHRWVNDPNVHVRRLISEGIRPRLPLASPLKQFIDDPEPVVDLLNIMKSNPELYVRRSIANNLNDISKDNPDIVTQTLKKWKSEDNSKNMEWLIKHALRTLIKRGNLDALDLLGFPKDPTIEIINFTLHFENIKIGSKLQFEFEIINKSTGSVNLMIDYIIYFMKLNGKTNPKVFKLSKKTLQGQGNMKFTKSHTITQLSTRKIYPGIHFVQLQINGKKGEKLEFKVIE